jgi:hypothetical protein
MRKKTKVNVQDEPTLERDSYSNALLNRDSHAYNMIVKRGEIEDEKNQKIQSLEDSVNELTALVKQLLEK